MRTPLPIRPLQPRRRRYVPAPAPSPAKSFFAAVLPIASAAFRVQTIFSTGESVREQIDRGRMISMASQQLFTIQRENEQARFCNGVILDPNRNQYI